MSDPNDPAAAGEVLSQSEVERLLAQVSETGQAVAAVATTDGPEAPPKDAVQPYDFRQPVFLSPTELRRLRIRNEEFIRALSARLSIYMRLEFTLQMSRLDTVPYLKFTTSLPDPTHLSLFKVEPLRGIGILDIHPRLGLTIVDRLLGGPAQSITANHEFSEIEMALLDQAVQHILGEWCSQWSGVQELHPVLLGHETNGQYLHTSPHDTILLVLTLEAKLGDCVEKIRIALPCSTLEPLIRKSSAAADHTTEAPPPVAANLKWNRHFDEVPVPVTALWDDLVLTARDIVNLKPGDILPLDPRSVRQVKLRLADLAKFEGHLGTTGGKWAVAVTSVVKPALSN